jgi:hypothetical protein
MKSAFEVSVQDPAVERGGQWGPTGTVSEILSPAWKIKETASDRVTPHAAAKESNLLSDSTVSCTVTFIKRSQPG